MSIQEGKLRIEVLPLRDGALEEHDPRKVRITHIPTGTKVESLAHSSTVTAKAEALEMLELELMFQNVSREQA